MPKMWKACLLQSYFGNRARLPKAAAKCAILQNSNFYCFLSYPAMSFLAHVVYSVIAQIKN